MGGRILEYSKEPFPGVPIKKPLQPQQPGEVLIRYELEAVSRLQQHACCTPGHLADSRTVLSISAEASGRGCRAADCRTCYVSVLYPHQKPSITATPAEPVITLCSAGMPVMAAHTHTDRSNCNLIQAS
jgi:hypothetical protein